MIAPMLDGGSAPRVNALQAATQAAMQKQKKGPLLPYTNAAQGEQNFLANAGPGMVAQMGGPQAALQAQRLQYAKKMLGNYTRAAGVLGQGNEFADALHGQDMSDPIAAFKMLSGLFTKQSQSQGVNDPRRLLAQLLMAARRR